MISFWSGYSFLLFADEVNVVTYDQQTDRETILIDGGRRLAALDYFYVEGNTSMLIWTDTASRNGEIYLQKSSNIMLCVIMIRGHFSHDVSSNVFSKIFRINFLSNTVMVFGDSIGLAIVLISL